MPRKKKKIILLGSCIMKEIGLYLHIPYCKRKCTYCNFHFSTQFSTRKELLDALHLEIRSRSTEVQDARVSTIYFGGGTPSVLSPSELHEILLIIKTHYDCLSVQETTLEANPDDLNPFYLDKLLILGIDRLSIGIQSFYDHHLEWMNRSHNATQGLNAIQQAKIAGFTKLSADLIFGIPLCTDEEWLQNLELMKANELPHLSCYALTVEEKTELHHRIEKNKMPPLMDEHTIRQMSLMLDFMQRNDYEAYEISNFSQTGHRAIHNSNYWNGLPYLGFGPSAHSYLGNSRRWNIANNNLYLKNVLQDQSYFESETLSKKDQYNEFIMLQLRRCEGLDLDKLTGFEFSWISETKKTLEGYVESGHLKCSENTYTLTREGIYICDKISSEAFAE